MKTEKVKKVLIALDYNPTAKQVAETGYSMAKTMNAEVTDMSQLQLDSVDSLKRASMLYLEKSKKHLGDKNIRTMVAEGDFADSILDTANKLYADIIVMGSHSRKWLENILMGSVTEKVLHNTSIPLFIIPTKKSK
jgi:nucleotide-binding universal stress UspA family protein